MHYVAFSPDKPKCQAAGKGWCLQTWPRSWEGHSTWGRRAVKRDRWGTRQRQIGAFLISQCREGPEECTGLQEAGTVSDSHHQQEEMEAPLGFGSASCQWVLSKYGWRAECCRIAQVHGEGTDPEQTLFTGWTWTSSVIMEVFLKNWQNILCIWGDIPAVLLRHTKWHSGSEHQNLVSHFLCHFFVPHWRAFVGLGLIGISAQWNNNFSNLGSHT